MLIVVMLGLTACVPNDGLVITQENITETKDDIAEGLSTRIDATAQAITDSVEAVKKDLLRDEDTDLSEDEASASPSEEEDIIVAVIVEEEEELPPPPPPSLDPKTLLGKSMADIAGILGTEDYRRLDQDVLVLQFRMPSCVIDLVMSSDRQVSSFHRRHRISGQSYDDNACQRDLAARRDERQ